MSVHMCTGDRGTPLGGQPMTVAWEQRRASDVVGLDQSCGPAFQSDDKAAVWWHAMAKGLQVGLVRLVRFTPLGPRILVTMPAIASRSTLRTSRWSVMKPSSASRETYSARWGTVSWGSARTLVRSHRPARRHRP